jgi:hypothetical protein
MIVGRIPALHKSKPEFLSFRGPVTFCISILARSIQATCTEQAKENYPEISFQINQKWTLKLGIYFQS